MARYLEESQDKDNDDCQMNYDDDEEEDDGETICMQPRGQADKKQKEGEEVKTPEKAAD